MGLIDTELNGVPVIGLEDTPILYSFGPVEGLEMYVYWWRALRTSKNSDQLEKECCMVWVNGRENFQALIALWNKGNRSFRYEEVP